MPAPATISPNSAQFQDLLARHRAFWTRGEGSLLRSLGLFASSAPVRLPQSDGRSITRATTLTPDMIDPAAMAAEAAAWPEEQLDSSLPEQSQFCIVAGLGDQMPLAHAPGKLPWLEAMLGCPVKMTDGQIWSAPYEGDPEDIIGRGASFEHNPWLELYLEFLRELQQRVGQRFPISANTLFRGACDLAAAILGVSEACLAWLDRPAFMHRLMRVCTDANLTAIEAGNKATRAFAGGYMSAFAVWAPGPVVRTQADHSTLLSPRIYEKQILPYDIEVIKICPYSILHLHNPGLHVAPLLLDVPELSAIEVVVDPYPNAERRPYEVAMYRRIQERKPLILDANFPSLDEAERLLGELEPRGLCFNARFEQPLFAALPPGLPGSRPWLFAGLASA